MEQTYIGDGVYASFDGYHVWLKTPAQSVKHEIALEPEVFRALCEYVQREAPQFFPQRVRRDTPYWDGLMGLCVHDSNREE